MQGKRAKTHKNLALEPKGFTRIPQNVKISIVMYEKENAAQLSFEDFYLPFGGHLKGDNRWVKLAGEIDWDFIEENYEPLLAGSGMGARALKARIIIGALIIKGMMDITDEETVQSITENPYMQYFLGYEGYAETVPFSPSTLTRARKRLPENIVNDINKRKIGEKLKKNSMTVTSRRTVTATGSAAR